MKLRSKTINSTNKKIKSNQRKIKLSSSSDAIGGIVAEDEKENEFTMKNVFPACCTRAKAGYITFFHKHTPNLNLYFVIVYDRTHTSLHCVISHIHHVIIYRIVVEFQWKFYCTNLELR